MYVCVPEGMKLRRGPTDKPATNRSLDETANWFVSWHKAEKQSGVLDRAPGNRQNAAQQEDRKPLMCTYILKLTADPQEMNL
jgi:hypothetical protein